ncbi:disease resistance protein [Tanacetum coccineum]
MADPFTSALVSDVVGRLTSTAIDEYGLLRRLKNDLSALENTFKLIQEVENVLDDAKTEAMIQRLHGEMGKKYKISAFFTSRYNPLMVKTRIAHKVKNKLKMENPTREEAKEMIVDKICNQDIGIRHDVDDVQVYAIWGIGGIGKTTLAQYVYNHETVKTHFDLKCWVYISAVFDINRITKTEIKAIYGPKMHEANDNFHKDDLKIQPSKTKSATDSSSLTKPIQKSQVVLVDIPENLAENDSIVAEHGLSSEITQSPEYSEDEASSKEGGFKTPHVQRSIRESRALEPSYVRALNDTSTQHKSKGFLASWAGRKPRVQIEGNFVRTDSSTEAMAPTLQSLSQSQRADNPLVFEMKNRCSKKQVGDEREVEVLRNFNWPLSELITNDGVLPVRGAIYRTEIKMRKVDYVGSGDVGIWMWGPTWIGDRISHVVNKKSQVVQCNW